MPPPVWIGAGEADIGMLRGQFQHQDKQRKDYQNERDRHTKSAGWAIRFTRGDAVSATLLVGVDGEGRLELKLKMAPPAITASGCGYGPT